MQNMVRRSGANELFGRTIACMPNQVTDNVKGRLFDLDPNG